MQLFILTISLIISSVLVSGCGQVKAKSSNAKPKVNYFPKKQPVPPTSNTLTRTLLFNVRIGTQLEQTLTTSKNLYTPDNCVQWVRYTGQGVTEDHIELSNNYCPYQGVAETSAVVARVKTKQGSSPAMHQLISNSGLALGELRVQGEWSNSPQDIWILEELCTASYRGACIVEVSASKFSGLSTN